MTQQLERLFTREYLRSVFPPDRTDLFFEALYGDAEEGAYDIELIYRDGVGGRLEFEFHLTQRPDKCLACSLTYGLPVVFANHPIIDVAGLVKTIGGRLPDGYRCGPWKLAATREIDRALHVLPLNIDLVRSPSSGELRSHHDEEP